MGRGLSDLEKFILKRVIELRGSLLRPETKAEYFWIESRDLLRLDHSHILYHKVSISRSIARLEKRRLAVRTGRGQVRLTRAGIRLGKKLCQKDWEDQWAGAWRIKDDLEAFIGDRGVVKKEGTASILLTEPGDKIARRFKLKVNTS